ncbi:MAG: hypothetical protein LBU64_09925 [Planctomycetota bacterium]|jgi:hypothetical protein|nr:hypothetical protein [Planctomycetota bacterium]
MFRFRFGLAISLAVFMSLPGTPAARALDSGDIRLLLQNRVPEETILNLIRADGSIYITTEEAEDFRALGASENLVATLRPRPTVLAPEQTVPDSGAIVLAPDAQAPAAVQPPGGPVGPVPVVPAAAFPPLREKEGWLSIFNHDQLPYFISANVKDERLFVSRHDNGGVPINPGQNLALSLRKNGYKLYGDSGRDLTVKIREGETTTLSFNPFGVAGNSGMTGVSTDREKTRSEVLFSPYEPPPAVIVQEPPVIIQEAFPPPILVVPDYPGYYRRPPPPPFGGRRGGRGGGFHFQFRR